MEQNKCEHVGPTIPDFGTGDEGDSQIIIDLKKEVTRLKKKTEIQSVNLVGGFKSIFKVKDEECKKLVAENAEIRRSLAALDEQVAKQAVHSVTQRFSSVNITNSCVHEYIVGNVVGVEDRRDHCQTVHCGIMIDAFPVASVPIVDNNEMHEGGSVVDGMNSFVRKIKGKVRKNLKLSGFEYPELRGRVRKVNNEVSVSKFGGVGCSVDKIFISFGITNRNTV
ncbi:hypothetical protein CsSME_00005315 [Camellia sinensis var. sinensis]